MEKVIEKLGKPLIVFKYQVGEIAPHISGIYVLKTLEGDVLYVGRSINIARRLKQHFDGNGGTTHSFYPFMYEALIFVVNENLDETETFVINELLPIFNGAKTNYESLYTEKKKQFGLSPEENVEFIKNLIIRWREETGINCEEGSEVFYNSNFVEEDQIKYEKERKRISQSNKEKRENSKPIRKMFLQDYMDILSPQQKQVIILKEVSKIIDKLFHDDDVIFAKSTIRDLISDINKQVVRL